MYFLGFPKTMLHADSAQASTAMARVVRPTATATAVVLPATPTVRLDLSVANAPDSTAMVPAAHLTATVMEAGPTATLTVRLDLNVVSVPD